MANFTPVANRPEATNNDDVVALCDGIFDAVHGKTPENGALLKGIGFTRFKWWLLAKLGKKVPLKIKAKLALDTALKYVGALPPHVKIALGAGVVVVAATVAIRHYLRKRFEELNELSPEEMESLFGPSIDAALRAAERDAARKVAVLAAEVEKLRSEVAQSEAQRREAEELVKEFLGSVNDVNDVHDAADANDAADAADAPEALGKSGAAA